MPTTDEFRKEIQSQLRAAELDKATSVDMISGKLHRQLGGYPSSNHQMPSCCAAMYAEQKPGDEVIYAHPKRKGATLTIRYQLPR